MMNERTINKTRLINERRWTANDVKDRLGPPSSVSWRSRTLIVWTEAEVEAAEAADPVFADRLKQDRERTAGRRHQEAVARQEAEDRQWRSKQIANWSTNLTHRIGDLDRLRAMLAYLRDCFEASYRLDDHRPEKSIWYYPELASTKGVFGPGSTPVPYERDHSKLLHSFSEGWAKNCRVQVSWRRSEGAKAVALLVHAGVVVDETCLREYSGAELPGRVIDPDGTYHIPNAVPGEWFTMRIEHAEAHKLHEYGDCSVLKLLD